MRKVFASSLLAAGLLQAGLASAYVLNGLSWPQPTTLIHGVLKLNGNANSPTGGTWDAAFSQSAQSWSTSTNFNLVIDSATASHPCAGLLPQFPEDYSNGSDFYPTACDDPWDPNVLAVTYSYYYQNNPTETIESDVIFNSNEIWNIYNGALNATVTDFKRVALHEQGHVIGLGHEELKSAIMQPYIGDLAALTADDIAGVNAIYPTALPELDPIKMGIQSPGAGDVMAGVDVVRGWVVALHQPVMVDVYRDGTFYATYLVDDPNAGVGNSFPEYPNSDRAGFGFIINFGLGSEGAHNYRFVARDAIGGTLEQTVNFTTERYDTPFVSDPNLVTLAGATVAKSGEDILISGLQYDGGSYNVRLRWRKQTQNFEAVDITKNP